METGETLNRILVDLFQYIMELEEKRLLNDDFCDLSYNHMHVIEAIGLEEPKKMSQIARRVSVTTGTLTRAIDSLEKKGYVHRQRSKEDKRVVYLTLTDQGVAAYKHHENFHKEMVAAVLQELSSEEAEVLEKTLEKIMEFFEGKYGAWEGKDS